MTSSRRGLGIGGHTRPVRGESDTWLTPRWVLGALGDFDLDPCTPPDMPWATASRRYTPSDDGLAQPWSGRVWLNPPYGPECARWLSRLADHGTGTAIVFARTETAMFFEQVWSRASACLFLRGRLTFCREDGVPGEHNSGGPSVLVAYGRHDAEILRTCGLDGQFVPLNIQDN